MKKEDLIQGKKYRHPSFNFDLHFDFNSNFIWVDTHGLRRMISLMDYDLEQLTEIRKIKVECDIWLCVDPSHGPTSSMDKIFGIYTDDEVYFEKDNAEYKLGDTEEIKKFRATFEEVDDDIK
jgi:hypothetical protein